MREMSDKLILYAKNAYPLPQKTPMLAFQRRMCDLGPAVDRHQGGRSSPARAVTSPRVHAGHS
jgi:hypothetical protein